MAGVTESFVIRRADPTIHHIFDLNDEPKQDQRLDEARADVIKSYTSLEEILMKFARVRTFKSKRKLKDVREWTIEDVLEIVQEATETSKKSSAPRNVYDYRQFKAALWSYNAVLDSARMHDTNQTRSLIWASLGYMFDLLSPLQSSPLQYKDILDYLLHIGRIFDDTMSVIAPLELEKPSRHLVAMECCFVDSLALVLQKWIRVVQGRGLFKTFYESVDLDRYVSEIEARYKSLRADASNEALLRQVRLNDQMNRMNTDIEARMKLLSRQTEQALHPMVGNEMVKMLGDMLRDRQSFNNRGQDLLTYESSTRQRRTNPSGSRSKRREYDNYIAYIDSPLVESLEHLRGFLPEEASHVSINLLDTPEITGWINSHTSSLLCLEGYLSGEPLNWTSEFSLDVIYAAQERGYAVLHHFCELLAFIGDRLKEGEGTLATTTILRAFLCLVRSQCSQFVNFSKALKEQDLDVRRVADLDDAEVEGLFSICLSSFKPDTVLYIVIDGIHFLTNWVQGSTLKQWLHELSLAAHKEHITTKILYTSSPSAETHSGIFELWTKNTPAAMPQADKDQTGTGGHSSNNEYDKNREAVAKETTKISKPPFRHQVVTIMKTKESGSIQAQARLLLQSAVTPIIHESSSKSDAAQIPSRQKGKARKEDSFSEDSTESTTSDTKSSLKARKTQKKKKKQAVDSDSETDSSLTSTSVAKTKRRTRETKKNNRQKPQKKKKEQAVESDTETSSSLNSTSVAKTESRKRQTRKKKKNREESNTSSPTPKIPSSDTSSSDI